MTRGNVAVPALFLRRKIELVGERINKQKAIVLGTWVMGKYS